jgi:uncharacterized protein YbjT (DUF2867 family)
MPAMAKIVITGATGTIGQEVARALLAAKQDVRIVARDPNKVTELKELGAEVVAGDLEDKASLERAFQGGDRLFLLTGFVEDCVPQVKNAVEAAKAAGVSFILRMSAAGADPNSPHVLAKHHGTSEDLVKDSGLRWAVIRPNFFMDNVLNYTGSTIKAQSAFYGAAGEGKSAYVSSRDVGESAAAILQDPEKHAGKTFDLSGGEAVSEADVARFASEAAGREIKYINLSSDDFRGGAASNGLPGWMVDAMVGLENIKANSWAAGTSTSVQDLTGRPPETFKQYFERNKARF